MITIGDFKKTVRRLSPDTSNFGVNLIAEALLLAARRARREALTEAIAELDNYDQTDIDARTRDLLVMKLERLRDSQQPDTKSESE